MLTDLSVADLFDTAITDDEIKGHRFETNLRMITKFLTNAYLVVSDDLEIRSGIIEDAFKDAIQVVAVEYVKMNCNDRSLTNDLQRKLAPLDKAVEQIFIGKDISISDKERRQIIYWFGKVRTEYKKRKDEGPVGFYI